MSISNIGLLPLTATHSLHLPFLEEVVTCILLTRWGSTSMHRPRNGGGMGGQLFVWFIGQPFSYTDSGGAKKEEPLRNPFCRIVQRWSKLDCFKQTQQRNTSTPQNRLTESFNKLEASFAVLVSPFIHIVRRRLLVRRQHSIGWLYCWMITPHAPTTVGVPITDCMVHYNVTTSIVSMHSKNVSNRQLHVQRGATWQLKRREVPRDMCKTGIMGLRWWRFYDVSLQ